MSILLLYSHPTKLSPIQIFVQQKAALTPGCSHLYLPRLLSKREQKGNQSVNRKGGGKPKQKDLHQHKTTNHDIKIPSHTEDLVRKGKHSADNSLTKNKLTIQCLPIAWIPVWGLGSLGLHRTTPLEI